MRDVQKHPAHCSSASNSRVLSGKLHGLNGISGRLIWQPHTEYMKGRKRLEARKLAEWLLQTLISQMMSLSQSWEQGIKGQTWVLFTTHHEGRTDQSRDLQGQVCGQWRFWGREKKGRKVLPEPVLLVVSLQPRVHACPACLPVPQALKSQGTLHGSVSPHCWLQVSGSLNTYSPAGFFPLPGMLCLYFWLKTLCGKSLPQGTAWMCLPQRGLPRASWMKSGLPIFLSIETCLHSTHHKE